MKRMSHLRKCRAGWAIIIAFLVLAAIHLPSAARAATTWVVDGDGLATADDCNAAAPAWSSIQEAVDNAAPGDTVFICPGTYDEQVAVTTANLTIQGSGAGSTIIRPSAVVVNSTGVLNPFPVAVILLIEGVTGVTVSDLTVDGHLADQGAGNPPCLSAGYYAGVYYRNGSGVVRDTHITKIGSASRCTAALTVNSGFETAASVVVTENLLDYYGNIGLNCAGPHSMCTVTGNTIRGLGPISDQIQGGIIFRLGAGGAISGNAITDHFYSPAVGMAEFSVGIALFNAEPNLNPHLKQTNLFAGNQHDVQRQSTAAAVE